MLKDTLSMSERLACKAVGLARSTYRRLPLAATPADPDAQLRAWLRTYATKHPCHGFRRAWAALRYDERREVNKKKVHRLWRGEGLQVRVHSPRKRAGVSSVPVVEADAPKVVWALDFQFDSTIDGKAIFFGKDPCVTHGDVTFYEAQALASLLIHHDRARELFDVMPEELLTDEIRDLQRSGKVDDHTGFEYAPQLVYARVTVHDVERHRRCLERHLDFVAIGFAAKSRL
jgi:hypothetical protein